MHQQIALQRLSQLGVKVVLRGEFNGDEELVVVYAMDGRAWRRYDRELADIFEERVVSAILRETVKSPLMSVAPYGRRDK